MAVRSGFCLLLILCLALLANCFDDRSPVSIDFNKPPHTPSDPEIDSIPPSPVTDAALIYSSFDNILTLEWTDPCDDAPEEPVRQYQIRYRSRSPFIWEFAEPVIDPPLPGNPGETAVYRFNPAHNGESLLCAIRALDEAGNFSPVGNVAVLKVPGYSFAGTCWDLESGSPAAGIPVMLISADTTVLLTDLNGWFRGEDLPLGTLRVMISGKSADSTWHDIDFTFDLVRHTDREIPMIPVRPIRRNPLVSHLSMFRAATEPCKGTNTLLKKWKMRPVAVYIPHWVNDNNIDYRIHAVAAVNHWINRTGLALFTIVDTPPETGIVMHYKTREEMGSLIGITRHTFDQEGYPLRDDIEIVDDFYSDVNLFRIFLHELGHTIRLCHMNFSQYIMYPGQPLPHDISDDEVAIVKMHELLPNPIDMSIYVDETP